MNPHPYQKNKKVAEYLETLPLGSFMNIVDFESRFGYIDLVPLNDYMIARRYTNNFWTSRAPSNGTLRGKIAGFFIISSEGLEDYREI